MPKKTKTTPIHYRSIPTSQPHLIERNLISHKQHRNQNAEELARGGDGGQHQRREVPHRVEDEHLPHRAAHAEQHRVLVVIPTGRRYAQTHAVLQQEGQTGLELLQEERRDEGHENAVDVKHFLKAQRGRLETGDHHVLLHAAHAIHAEREDEEDEAQVAVGLRADLLVVAHELENWG